RAIGTLRNSCGRPPYSVYRRSRRGDRRAPTRQQLRLRSCTWRQHHFGKSHTTLVVSTRRIRATRECRGKSSPHTISSGSSHCTLATIDRVGRKNKCFAR